MKSGWEEGPQLKAACHPIYMYKTGKYSREPGMGKANKPHTHIYL